MIGQVEDNRFRWIASQSFSRVVELSKVKKDNLCS